MRTPLIVSSFLLLVVVACSEPPSAPEAGMLHLSVRTTGGDLDEDGYGLSLDGTHFRNLAVADDVDIPNLVPGQVTVMLTGLAPNCRVSGQHPRVVMIERRATTPLAFDVACVPTGVRITVVTRGVDVDADGYTVSIDAAERGVVPANGSLTITRLPAGARTVRLAGFAANCGATSAAEHTITLEAEQIADVAFDAQCTAVTASIRIAATTTGRDLDPLGYIARVNGTQDRSVDINGSVTIDHLGAGTHRVDLIRIPKNCAVAEGTTRTVELTIGDTVRHTALVPFGVTCNLLWRIAFVRSEEPEYYGYYYELPLIMLSAMDQDGPTDAFHGDDPAWAPDGERLAFRRFLCPWYCNAAGIGVRGYKETEEVVITGNPGDRDPAWRPDGQRIAFTRWADGGSRIFTVAPNGTDLRSIALPSSVHEANAPAWSPDGTQLAFGCRIDGRYEICRVAEDGSGFARLTSDTTHDADPDWSPDGVTIAFTSIRDGIHRLGLIASDGGPITLLTVSGHSLEPVWSLDGTTILFGRIACTVVRNCATNGLAAIAPDDTGLRWITNARDRSPAWRR